MFRDAAPHDAVALASELAGGLDVRLGGGATVVREFLDADLVDHMHIVVVPIVLGRGVRLWDGQERLRGAVRYRDDRVTVGCGAPRVHAPHVAADR